MAPAIDGRRISKKPRSPNAGRQNQRHRMVRANAAAESGTDHDKIEIAVGIHTAVSDL
jgi:hypothetical protein